MAQADTLVALVQAASSGDQQSFRQVAEALISEEAQKGHRVLAERLRRSLANASTRQRMTKPSVGQSTKLPSYLFDEIEPKRGLESLLLSNSVTSPLMDLIEEQHRTSLLHSFNLSPRNRILLVGPPGNGKTTLAEALSFELMVPLCVVRYENLIGSYLGETANRVQELLDQVRTRRCVLFFDEFDTVAKERGDQNDTGEVKRVVSSLLMQIDRLPDYVVLVVASNHPDLLDKAVWRRFQLRLQLSLPTRAELVLFIERFMHQYQMDFGYASETLAKHLYGTNFAEVEEFCFSIARQAVLKQQTRNARAVTQKILLEWRQRVMPDSN